MTMAKHTFTRNCPFTPKQCKYLLISQLGSLILKLSPHPKAVQIFAHQPAGVTYTETVPSPQHSGNICYQPAGVTYTETVPSPKHSVNICSPASWGHLYLTTQLNDSVPGATVQWTVFLTYSTALMLKNPVD